MKEFVIKMIAWMVSNVEDDPLWYLTEEDYA